MHRAFRKDTGQSPAKAIESLRVEAARVQMEQGQHPMHTVARQTGFADRDQMRRAFIRTLGQSPQTIAAMRKLRSPLRYYNTVVPRTTAYMRQGEAG